MAKIQYCDELEKYATDNMVRPIMTALVNMKGEIFLFGVDNLNNNQRLEILQNAYWAMTKIVEDEKRGMRNTMPIDPTKLTPLK